MGMLSKYTAGNSQWLKSEDMEGWEGPTVIQFADEYEVKDSSGKTDVKAGFTFAQFPEKPYLTNVTNARRIEEILTKQKGVHPERAELQDCIGLKVWLYTEPTQTPSGGQTMGIRIKEIPANFAQMVENGHVPAGGVSSPGPRATASDRPPTPMQPDGGYGNPPASAGHANEPVPPPTDADRQFDEGLDETPF